MAAEMPRTAEAPRESLLARMMYTFALMTRVWDLRPTKRLPAPSTFNPGFN